jgi:hypothetical protein
MMAGIHTQESKPAKSPMRYRSRLREFWCLNDRRLRVPHHSDDQTLEGGALSGHQHLAPTRGWERT